MNLPDSLARWRKPAIIAAAILIIAAAGYFGYARFFGSQPDSTAEDQQTVAVRRGDLIERVSISGSVDFPDSERLVFGTAGTVEEVNVKEGERVSEGDALASLDPETIAGLEQALAQANIDLRDAENALADFRETPPLTLAQANQAVAKARADIVNAEDALEAIANPSEHRIAEARAAVSAAELKLRQERDALDDMLEKPTDISVTRAETDVAAKRLALQRAEKALEDLLEPPTDVSLARAEANVAAKRLALQRAEKALEDLLEPPTDAATADADERIAKARSALDAAEKRRDDYENQEGIADAQRRVEKAQTAVERAERDLAAARYDVGKNMDDSTETLDAAAKNYVDQFAKWLGMEVSVEDIDPDYAKALSDMGIDLAVVFSKSGKALDLIGPDAPQDVQDDPATPFDDRVVFVWLSHGPFTINPTCGKDDNIPLYAVCVENEFRTNGDAYKAELATWNAANLTSARTLDSALDTLDNAEKELEDAREALADMDVDAAKLAEYEAATVSARAEIDAAIEDREKMDEPPTPQEVADQNAKIALAEREVDEAAKDLAELRDPPTPEEVADQNAKIALAEREVDEALKDLEEMRARDETDAAAIADARERIKVAEAAIAEREEDLAKLLSGEDHPDYAGAVEDANVATRALAEREKELRDLLPEGRDALRGELLALNVSAAQSGVSQAARRLDDATLTAPWDGFVSQVEVKKGDEVESGALAVELVNTNIVEIDGGVDEIDVLRIELGTPAEVTLDALEGRTLAGGVSFIDAAASNNQGIVSIPVKVRLDDPGDLQIPKGVSAVATITISEVRDVLLVPQRALRGTFSAPTLQVMVGEETTEVPVTIGESDDFMVVIESGVSEGDMVVAGPDDGSVLDGFGGPGGGPRGNGPRGENGPGGGP